jgi:hypothetical protein
MGCRKNQAILTPAEKTAFVNAVLALKNHVPSQMGLISRYDDYVQVHMNAMMASPGWGHQACVFLPWHRQLLHHFELDLQAIDPTVTIPYWDWTVDQDPSSPTSPFTDTFLGGDGDPSTGEVVTGPFAAASGNWTKNVLPGAGDPDNVPYLRRQFGVNAPTLPSPAQLAVALGQPLYDEAPWTSQSASAFRNHLEGWIASGPNPNDQPPQLHNRVHVWVGGSMLPMTSPNDPVFWLNHANIDRLWEVWKTQNPASAPYLPPSGTPGVPTGWALNDTMIFFGGGPAPWPDTATPASVIDNHGLGYWYDTDRPSVHLLTPSVSFGNVQEGIGGTGITTYRAIKFECESCGDVTLQITAGPTAGFGAPSLSETVQANHDPTSGLTPDQGALWVSYTSTTAGSSVTGAVTVQAVDVNTGQVFGPWTVNLSAATIARQRSAVVLVLDRSGSMALDAGNGHQRVELLRTAVSTFIDLMQQGDGIGIVRFDNLVDTLMPVTDVGPIPTGAGRSQAQNIVTTHDPAMTIDPRGSTSIGGGIVAGKAALNAVFAAYPQRAMIVLTDGLENTPPMIASVASSLTAQTFAIGFGQAAAISTSALNAITQNHGGYLIVTGPITPEENFALTEYFLKVQAGVNNTSAILDPRGELVFGTTHRIPFRLTSADLGVDVVLLSPAPYYIEMRLQAPNGTIIDPSFIAHEPAISFVGTPRVSYYRASLPMLSADPAGSRAGQWYVLLGLSKRAEQADPKIFAAQFGSASLPYSLLVHAYSNLSFQPSVSQDGFEPGATVRIKLKIDQYDVPLDSAVNAWAEIQPPNSPASSVLTLDRTDTGRFGASFTAVDNGVYTVFVRARGITLEGEMFEREERLTAVVFLGGNNPEPPSGDDDPLCRLISCLSASGAVSPELEDELRKRGLNLPALIACLTKQCYGSEASLGGEVAYDPAQAGPDITTEITQFVQAEDVLRALMSIEQAAEASGVPTAFAQLAEPEPHPTPQVPAMIQNFGIDVTKQPQGAKSQRRRRSD